MEQLTWLLTGGALLIFSGFFSCSETAFFSLPAAKVKTYRTSANPRSRLIAQLLEKPRDLLVTVFMLNTLGNILLQNVVSAGSGPDSSWGLKVVLPFILLLFFAEVIPKYIGLQKNITLSHLTAPGINFFQNLISPLRRWTVAVTEPVSRMMFFYLKREQSISSDEMKHVLRKSEEHGVLHPDESELVWGYLNLQDVLVKEVMRPREDILYYDIKEPLTKLEHLFIDQEVSRIPVCENDIQNLIGIMTARTFFIHQHKFIENSNTLRSYLSKPFYIPENTQAKVLLRRLDAMDGEMALVVDEYGAITGLVTYEDLIEVVIGQIADLRDKQELYVQSGSDGIIANGKMEMLEFNEIFDVDLYSPNNMVTLGGWLTEKIGGIPKSGFNCEYDGFSFKILAAEPTHIKRIYVRKLKHP